MKFLATIPARGHDRPGETAARVETFREIIERLDAGDEKVFKDIGRLDMDLLPMLAIAFAFHIKNPEA